LKVGLVVVIAVLVFWGIGQRRLRVFQIKKIETRGIARASNESIMSTVRRMLRQQVFGAPTWLLWFT
jgi:hypothetical protein